MAINPERWPEVSRLFAATVALDRPVRQSYLDNACDGDSALRAAIDSLLAAHDEAGSFGEGPLALADAPRRLTPGTRLGPFHVEAFLGAGGMGEVYRARDTKLQRDVAVKVLPDSFAADPDRLSRFEEEARALAALNHPHIGAIYGVEENGDVVALVLELVDGPTLAERLAAGPLAVDEILWIARQLAEGLEAAHDRGIVHRDLKPANIKIAPDGNVKLLDFGLAKPDMSQGRPAAHGSSPVSPHVTHVGVIVGTAAYMSPEQARGQIVDKRADIWAFGCVLFEMCAGRPPFAGASVADTLTAVVEREPDWTLLPASTAVRVVRVLHRCLTKDPKLRLRDIGEARIALGADTDAETLSELARPARRRATIVAVAGVLALASSLGIVLYRSARTPVVPIRFSISPPQGEPFYFHPGRTPFALSPDGMQLAFITSNDPAPSLAGGADRRIWLRAMGDLEARPVPGTEGAGAVFWSPDGRSLGFLTDDKLKRVDLPARPAVTICDVPFGGFGHGTWGAGGTILIGRGDGTEIYSVPAAGGVLRTVVARNPANHEVRVHWPWFLPDGDRFLYTARLEDGDGELRVGQLDGSTRRLTRVSSNAQWVDPDIVVFVQEGVLMGQRVDLVRARAIAEPFTIADNVEYFFTTSRAMFSVSRTGTLAYHTDGGLQELVWVDGRGNEVGTAGTVADYDPSSARLSHDGSQLLVSRKQAGLGTYDIWRLDLLHRTEEQLTTNRGTDIAPVWLEGERAIVYSADSPGSVPHLFRMDLTTRAPEQVLPPGRQQLAMDVFPGEAAVAYAGVTESGDFYLFKKPLAAGAPPVPLLGSRPAGNMRLSPDGRAMAYLSESALRQDVYVAAVPVDGAPEIVAQGVAGPPRWSGDGRHLYFMSSDRVIMTVPVDTAPRLTIGTPRPLFELKRPASSLMLVARDGRFLLLVPRVRAEEYPIVVATAAIGARLQ